ncbi:uncharacterized protein K452DRAFT_114658 [Aplosporella prunicola CBS 121167]|uniref:Uncharacterized protein n=1 Tax=Aplosporella prunicola CBS 121167 TaxID=1176127 RepID=A0A6A6B2N6_9PEZI|nr:uncharacterized protein K452DRAFT_114658 [Aplosporella prunicola CBS 121167]KAF2136991.1 hypothetical protein K452DRAFT_114658 [Aplosporella prunicola CBS 121167]
MAPSKFSFHLHHRRHRADKDKEPERLATPAYSVRSDDVSSQPSKAERLLGTGLPGRHTGSAASVAVGNPYLSAPHALLDTKQTYMSSLSLPERRKGSATSADDLVPPRWQSHTLYHRPSSNVLGPSAGADEADGDGRSGSVSSTGYSKTLHSQKSSTTLQSHYDPRRPPLPVSQQTSASAMRDGGLRRGHTPLHQSTTSVDQISTHSSTYEEYDNESGKSSRKKKPARLDLSKLFPKAPKAKYDNVLLSPSLFVSLPAPLLAPRSIIPNHYPPMNTRSGGRRLLAAPKLGIPSAIIAL